LEPAAKEFKMTWMDKDGNISHVRGDDFSLTFTDFKEDDIPINWTGWNVLIQVRENANATEKIVEFKNPDDIDLSVEGVMLIAKSHTAFDHIAKTYVYDMQVTRPDNKISTWLNNKKFFLI
jgi:hypothetical protein